MNTTPVGPRAWDILARTVCRTPWAGARSRDKDVP
jgi:hypothetical protein